MSLHPNLDKLALLFPALGCCILSVTAQTGSQNILTVAAKAVYTADNKIIVRWTPANFKTWEWGRDSGYLLIRVTLEDQNGPLPSDEQSASVVNVALTPKTQNQWEAAMLTDSIVGVAAGAFYGEDFTVAGPDNEGIVTAHNINSEKENRFGLSLFVADVCTLAAEMMNLYYRDESVTAGYKYAYIIRPRGNAGIQPLKPGRVTVKATEPYAPPPPAEFSGQAGDSLALLSWNQIATGEHYTGYNVWRSHNGGPYEKITAQPIAPTDRPTGEPEKQQLYYAPLDNNTDTFKFKISGYSPFGFDGPFSEVVAIKGIPSPLRAAVSVEAVKELASGMEVNWEFPDSLNAKIQGFNVLRAAKHEGPYVPLNTSPLDKTLRKYTDPDPQPLNYYKVEFVDQNDNKVPSAPQLAQTKDSIAPEPPVQVSGEAVGDDGTLRIHWPPSPEADVMGYRVFVADRADGNYGQITSTWIADTVFYHKVNAASLSEKKFFKVKALDFRENTSEFSPVCGVAIPDIVPPSMPVLKKTEPQANGVLVEFAPSSSKDVQAHKLLRKKKDDAEWVEVAAWDALSGQASVSYLDTSAEKMYSYGYMIQAVDDADRKSNSKVFPTKYKGDGARATVTDFDVKFVKSDDVIRLTWKYANAHGVAGFVIYRGTQSAQLYETAFVVPQQVLKGGKYDGPDPFAAPPSGINAGNAAVTAVAGQLPANSFDLKQTGSPNTTHATSYEHADKHFLRFKSYYYAIAVKYADGTFSPMSAVKSTSAY